MDHPILFSRPMVCAVKDNRKTQTRRELNLDRLKPARGCDVERDFHSVGGFRLQKDGTWGAYLEKFPGTCMGFIKCPYGKVGDRLWVREAWRVASVNHNIPRAQFYTVQFRDFGVLPHPQPDRSLFEPLVAKDKFESGDISSFGRWRPSIHMPRWASRVTLEITGIRVERLQCIWYEDAIAEGIERIGNAKINPRDFTSCWCDYTKSQPYWNSPIDSFHSLWESINGPASWKANPFVWVVSFKKIPN